MLKVFRKGILLLKIVLHMVGVIADHYRRSLAASKNKSRPTTLPKNGEEQDKEFFNIVIIGASFAGYHAARLIASGLTSDNHYRIVIIEPNSHYQFTWTLPRFCVVEGHEDKTFIPYGPYLPPGSEDFVRWVHQRAELVTRDHVKLQGTGEEIPYKFLVIATGAGVGLQLPSRVGAEDKAEGGRKLREMQERIKNSQKLVVVGGGAAGVELATDAKQYFPDKSVTLVHSRDAVMHRFGPELQAAALKALKDLGVEVLLGERTVAEDTEAGTVTLKSGRTIECDVCVHCMGQRPSSGLIAALAPDAITGSGHIRVKPTMQIDAPGLPNVYACGDVIEAGVRNPNSRAAMKQATYVADNVSLAVKGQVPTYHYKAHFADEVIKLTLGLDKSVSHIGDDTTELLFPAKEKKITLMVDQAWTHMGATPFQDEGYQTETV